ncbi:unnamed protein product [Auanema sp. JU1783]|nr:unnamed protein product [Auanema sp. JU1783]
MHYRDFSYEEEEPSLWIFGYGSLIWNPGFNHDGQHKAYARGFARRMYQGNTFHRGDEQLPGRVATLIEHPSAYASGVVFRVDGVTGISKAVAHLKERELDNGYEFRMVPVDIVFDSDDEDTVNIMALTCIARRDNQFYLGPDNVTKMAKEICIAKGRAGPNHEYVLKLAEHVRRLFPEEEDDHLFELESLIRTTSS